MSDPAFIYTLALGGGVGVTILVAAQVSHYRLLRRLDARDGGRRLEQYYGRFAGRKP